MRNIRTKHKIQHRNTETCGRLLSISPTYYRQNISSLTCAQIHLCNRQHKLRCSEMYCDALRIQLDGKVPTVTDIFHIWCKCWHLGWWLDPKNRFRHTERIVLHGWNALDYVECLHWIRCFSCRMALNGRPSILLMDLYGVNEKIYSSYDMQVKIH